MGVYIARTCFPDVSPEQTAIFFSLIQRMSENDNIICDGSFENVPVQSRQIFSVEKNVKK